MKKVLFLDRDGTLIIEPPEDFQVDSLEKLEFYPAVFRNLYQIHHNLDFILVIVSNQDGLGTPSYPREHYEKVQEKFIQAFRNEGIEFEEVIIDETLPEQNAPTRKPGTALLEKYMNGGYDLENSYVIGDRFTDVELARNLGCRAILIGDESKQEALNKEDYHQACELITHSWDQIREHLSTRGRKAVVHRETSETSIYISLNLQGSGKADISTGLAFFDHMLEQIPKHSGVDLEIKVKGDLEVDEHHTIEDTGLALGEAFLKALGTKKGIERYGFLLPMDESLAQVAIDFGGRNWIVWDAYFKREKIGDMPTEMFFHFFKSFTDSARCNLNISVKGDNEHHKIEGIFKAFSRALKMAIRLDPNSNTVPSTKGTI